MQSDVNPAAEDSERMYEAAPVLRTEHAEGTLTRTIEQQTARIPSDVFLVFALGAMLASIVAEFRNQERVSRFVGMWPAPLLVMGVYNKMVKLLGPR